MSVPNKAMKLKDGKILYDDLRTRIEEVSASISADYSTLTNTVNQQFEDKISEPTNEGTAGQVLTTDGNGGRTWTTVSGGGGSSITVDSALSSVSENPVQNKIINEALIGKAPAIIGSVTGYRHEDVDSFVMNGNSYAFGNARYANKKNLIVGTDRSYSYTGITVVSHDNIVIINGTASSSNDIGIWTFDDVDIDAGSYTFAIEPYIGTSTLSKGKNMHLDLWYDGNTSSTYDKRVTLSAVQDLAKSSTFSITDHVYKIRVWVGYTSNTYVDYRLFCSLFPSDVTITDTGETIASDGTLTVTPVSTMTALDTMMHTSTTESVIDTKTYIDEHSSDVDFIYFRPEDYGAVGNGSTDDSAALQACIDAAQAYGESVAKAIRGFGSYKISTGLTFNCRELDVFLNKIIYTGDDAAITISGSFSTFAFQSIRAVAGGSNAVGIRCYQSVDSGYTTTFFKNVVKCNYIRCNGNTVEFKAANGITNNSMMYNKFYFQHQASVNSNIIYVEATASNENDFYGKLVSAQNGYLVYFASGVTSMIRLFHYCLENELKNGTNGSVKFYFCRFTEMLNLQTREDHTSGHIFVWENCVPGGCIIEPTSGVDLTSVDVTNAYSWEDCLNLIKTVYDDGETSPSSPWMKYIPSAASPNPTFATLSPIARSANANMTTDGGMVNMQEGEMIVYYKNIAFKPFNEIRYTVTDDLTILLSESNNWKYITPTVFDINTTSATITLDASYCAIAINKFDVIQHEGKTAIVVDKLGNTIFDGTNLGAGTYHFKCDIVPYQYGELYITMANNTVKNCPSGLLQSIYSGYNEQWTVEAPSDGAIDSLSEDIAGKLDAPSTTGTAGQVLGLDSNLMPAWIDPASVTQTLTSGTAIATINGVTIYAPSYTDADGVSY